MSHETHTLPISLALNPSCDRFCCKTLFFRLEKKRRYVVKTGREIKRKESMLMLMFFTTKICQDDYGIIWKIDVRMQEDRDFKKK